MSDNTTNPMLAKIQGLLDTYQSLTDTNPEGAQAYLDKAEQLMQKYAVDEAMLSAARQLAGGIVEEPDQRVITFMPANDKLGNQWYNLIIGVAKHYDCEFFGWTSGTGYLVGFPSNMDLVEMVYTSLRLQALSKLDPKPVKELGYDENVYILHESGLKWQAIAHQMNKAWHEAQELGLELGEGWSATPWDEKRKDGGKLIKAAKRWSAKIGEPYRAVQSPVTFQRSYAQGFLNEVRDRFARLRKYREDQIRSTNGAELVLFDRNKLVQDAMDALKAAMGHKDGKGYRQRIDTEAYYRGKEDGRTADIGQDRMGGSKKELS